MRDTARGIRFVVARTWRASPPRVMVSAVVTLLLAFVPALQVLALATLVERLDGEHTLRDVLAPLLVIVAIVGLANPVRAVATTLRVDADHTVIADLERELMLRAARTPPRDLARAETTARLQKQVEVAHASAQYLYGQLVGAIESVVATIAVVAALATFSRLAALLTVLALVPALIAGRLLAGVWRRYWDVVGPIFGRQRYLSNLLVRQRSAVELATLGAGDAVAARHGRLWRDLVGHRIRLSRRELASDWIVGAVSTVFVLGALVALLVGTDLSPVAVGRHGCHGGRRVGRDGRRPDRPRAQRGAAGHRDCRLPRRRPAHGRRRCDPALAVGHRGAARPGPHAHLPGTGRAGRGRRRLRGTAR